MNKGYLWIVMFMHKSAVLTLLKLDYDACQQAVLRMSASNLNSNASYKCTSIFEDSGRYHFFSRAHFGASIGMLSAWAYFCLLADFNVRLILVCFGATPVTCRVAWPPLNVTVHPGQISEVRYNAVISNWKQVYETCVAILVVVEQLARICIKRCGG